MNCFLFSCIRRRKEKKKKKHICPGTMPLYNLNTPHYLNRRRVFIDADERDTEQSRSIWDASYILDRYYSKIQAIELVSYNIPRYIMPTFVNSRVTTDGKTVVGNNKLDIRLADVPETRSLTFTVTFPPGRYDSVSDFTSVLPTLIETAMDAEGDAFFNTGAGVNFTVFTLPSSFYASDRVQVVSDISGDHTAISMEYLFGTGTNKDSSAWNVFGFKKGTNNGGLRTVVAGNSLMTPITLYDPVPDSEFTVAPYRYIDVYIQEAPELNPVARIFMTDEKTTSANYTTNQLVQNRPRLLTDLPLRKLQNINVRLEFEGGILPTEEFECGYDLIFDFLVLSPEQDRPKWTNQQLTY